MDVIELPQRGASRAPGAAARERSAEAAAPASSYWRSLLAWDSVLFFTLCTLDMLSTLWWIQRGVATESNPWLAACLRVSPVCFCVAKSVSYIPVLLICAYYRASYPRCIMLGLRIGALVYVAIYAICVGIQFLG